MTTSAIGGRAPGARPATRRDALLPYVPLALAALVFAGLTAWWLIADSRIPDYDTSRHLGNTFALREAIAGGDILAPITQDNLNHYPPLLYLVGSLASAIVGEGIDAAIVGQDVVFVSLLAIGCFGAARLAYGTLAGALAATFALGTPMVTGMFHAYMLDAPQTAMVAVSVWLLIASRRFEAPGLAALAGAAAGGGMLLKATTAIVLCGFVLALVARGGWRNPLGLAAFALAGAVVALPWYIEHLDQVRGLTEGATASATPGVGAPSYVTPLRWSSENFGWYAWNFLNVQYLAPLTILFVTGAATAAWRFVRTRDPHDVTPELLAGGLVAYLGITYLSLKDPRYTLPALVYVATLAAGWIPSVRSVRLRIAAAAATTIVAAFNIVAVSTGFGPSVRISFPGAPATLLGERSVTFSPPSSYVVAEPRDDGEVLEAMKAVRASGVRRMEVDPTGDATFNFNGLQLLMHLAGLEQPAEYRPDALGPDTAFMLRHVVPPGGPEPCARLDDGATIYIVLQENVVVPFETYRFYCPRRRE